MERRGGPRKNAGRKKLANPKKPITFYVVPEIANKIKKIKEQDKESIEPTLIKAFKLDEFTTSEENIETNTSTHNESQI